MRTGPLPTSLSGASLPSAFFSLLAHASVVVAGLIMIPVATSEIESTPMVYIPIELVTIADTTNVAPVYEKIAPDEEPAAPETEAAAAPAPPSAPPKPEDVVALDPPKPEAPKDKPKAAPAPPQKSLSSEIDSIVNSALASASKETPAPKRNDPNAAPASADTGPPRRGAGDLRRDTATVVDFIRAQLISNKCWTDHSDMADAARLRVTIRIAFDRNGRLTMSQLIKPAREPTNDVPLQTYLAHARRALDMCSRIGWRVPPEYYNLPPANQQLDIEFLSDIATR